MKNNTDKTNNAIEGAKNAPSVIMRKCCACGKITNRNEFIRILTDYETGEIIINPTNKDFGRSTYLCKDESCLKLAIKKKRLKNLDEEKLEILKNIIIN